MSKYKVYTNIYIQAWNVANNRGKMKCFQSKIKPLVFLNKYLKRGLSENSCIIFI